SVNLLPCRINYTGPTNATKNHWSPSPSSSTAYFRGRRLVGKDVELPKGYTGTPSLPL
ncbi:hypothetical protein BDD12DRAFT_811615, partial [Trichophaea hybrida]